LYLRVASSLGEVPQQGAIALRQLHEIKHRLSMSETVVESIRVKIERLRRALTELTGARAIQINIVSERGPRRLELEPGGGVSTFHTDASGIRIVAPLLGPQTLFLLADQSANASAPLGLSPTNLSGPMEAGFDFDAAIRANFESLIGSSRDGSDRSIYRAQDGCGIIFVGTGAIIGRPLTHAAPQPRDAAEALAWGRLFVTLDARH
jgi:hypothetical protein